MNKKLHIIFIPGLGAGGYTGQRWAVRRWERRGVTAELFPANWGDGRPWEPKLKRLLARIDEAAVAGDSVALVGASAGASAAINAFAARKDTVAGVVCIAGKINRPETIGRNYRDGNPAFVTSAYDCAKALGTLTVIDRRHILSRYGLIDTVVATRDSRIPGARNRFSPTLGHSGTIAIQITLGAPSFIRFLKRLKPQA